MAEFDIAFGGGGSKGMAYAGALEVLLRRHTVRRLVGSSAGGLIATAVALGYRPEDLERPVNNRAAAGLLLQKPDEKDFPEDQQGPLRALLGSLGGGGAMPNRPILGGMRRPGGLIAGRLGDRLYQGAFLLERGAVFTDRNLMNVLNTFFLGKLYNPAQTLAQLFAKTGKHLSLTATDTTDKELVVLNHLTAPDLPAVWAVRMTVAAPFVWPEVVWKKEWGAYRGRPKAGNTVIDGSILANFPIRYLLDRSEEAQAVMGPAGGDARVLGLFIDERRPAPGSDPDAENQQLLSQLKPYQTLTKLLETIGAAGDEAALRQADAEKVVCRIGAKGFDLLNFDLTREQFDLLVNSGRCAMTDHLQKLGL
jgi:predicted acylesterase/phospholipase RssA